MGSFSVSRRSGIPYSGEVARTENISSTSSSGLQHSTQLSSSSGKDSILSRNGSKCKIVHTPNPNAFVTKLESNKNVYGLPNSCYTMAKATFEMVVTGSNYLKGSVSSTNSVYRDSASDTSLVGWGVHMNNLTVQGRWSNVPKMSHINCLEMVAIYLTVKDFLSYLVNENVLI